jgi:phage internal scaffolding protein
MSKQSPTPPRVYSAFDTPPSNPQIFEGASLTRQEFALNGDVNSIVQEFTRTGIPPVLGRGDFMFADVSKVPSYQEAQNIIIAADKAFNDLPSKVRKRLKTPAEMIDFLNDPENEVDARNLGLLKPVVTPSPTTPAEPLEAASAASPAP